MRISKPSPKTLLRRRASEKTGYHDALHILHFAYSDKGTAADRALAIQGAAMIEHALEARITEKLSPKLDSDDLDALFGISANGPISTLGARILIAHALGIFGDSNPERPQKHYGNPYAFGHSASALDFDAPEFQPLRPNLHTISSAPRGPPETARVVFT